MDSTKINYLFYSENISKTTCLDELESKHCVGVLRKRAGDEIVVTDGLGFMYYCKILDTKPKACVLNIVKTEEIKASDSGVFIGICPTKNADRIEYFLEKATEIGINGFYFIKSQHTVTKNLNEARCNKIVVSAMKQSLKAFKPEVSALMSFDAFLKTTEGFESKFIAHLDNDALDILNVKKTGRTLIMIGPEGDFSKEEILKANAAGFKTVKMGDNRLRTETAGIVAASILTLI
jgi:16S rRNA (uracil1498-N3)-methyltransferase